MKQAYPFGHYFKSWAPWSLGPDRWHGFCPNCKRPIDAYLSEKWRPTLPKPEAHGKYAFLICLWGASPNYVVGAMVLGYSIKKTGSKHARVCLYTEDVPPGYVEILSQLWDCRLIEHVDACVRTLSFSEKEDRFEKVFTKLRGMELTEFGKVLMMDIDLLVRENIDHLFELPAPAAMRRGMNDRYPYKHGDTIDGRSFFLGHDNTKWSWGQGTGINAGVMLWQPDKDSFEEMLSEIQEPNHPEHCKGNGPEQDFLSRYWADAPWTHIGVEYNFQLHQMFFAIHPDRADRAERATLLSAPESIKIVHFSGEPSAKPWHRVLDDKWTDFWPDRSRDAEYATLFADEFLGHWLWVRKDRATFDNTTSNSKNWDMEGMFLDEHGEIWRKSRKEGEPPEHLEVPEAAARGAVDLLSAVLREWFDALQALEVELGFGLRERLAAVALGTGAAFNTVASAARALTVGSPPPSRAPAPELRQTVDGGAAWWVAEAAAAEAAAAEAVASAPGPQQQRQQQQPGWRRHGGRSSWWTESAPWLAELPGSRGCPDEENSGTGNVGGEAFKATVVCGGSPSGRFVAFVEAGLGTYDEQDLQLAGVFVKVVGAHSPRHFRMPDGLVSDDFDEALGPIHLWVNSVPEGALVLIALVCVAPESLVAVLAALAPLGVPQVPPPPVCKALAAVGHRPAIDGNSYGVAWQRHHSSSKWAKPSFEVPRDMLYSSHASRDIAYASMVTPHFA